MIRKKLLMLFSCISVLSSTHVLAQTFFESAEGDGVIAFRSSSLSQIKLNLAATDITYGYYGVWGNDTKTVRFLPVVEVKIKPNDDGIGTLLKSGKLQPGFQTNIMPGLRFHLDTEKLRVLDIYVRGEFAYNNYIIFDSSRINNGSDARYEASKLSSSVSLIINHIRSLGENGNLYFGAQIGKSWGTNVNDLDDGTLQSSTVYNTANSQYLFSNVEEVKIGALKNITDYPVKADLVVDPGIKLSKQDATNVYLGFFGYYRRNLNIDKNRLGLGVCFIDSNKPSKIYTSIGYELPTLGDDVTDEHRKADKGIVFASIGYTIF